MLGRVNWDKHIKHLVLYSVSMPLTLPYGKQTPEPKATEPLLWLNRIPSPQKKRHYEALTLNNHKRDFICKQGL